MMPPETDYEISDTEWAEAKAEASLRGISTREYLWNELKKGEPARMSTLMELSGEYRLLLNTMDSAEPEEIQVFEDTLESVLAEAENKADGYAVVINEATATAKKFKAEAERLNTLATALENKITYMKDKLKEAMEQMGVDKLQGEYHKISIVNNGGSLPVIITGTVPPEYQKQKITVSDDKTKIGQALKDGVKLNFAHFGERGTHLKIDQGDKSL